MEIEIRQKKVNGKIVREAYIDGEFCKEFKEPEVSVYATKDGVMQDAQHLMLQNEKCTVDICLHKKVDADNVCTEAIRLAKELLGDDNCFEI